MTVITIAHQRNRSASEHQTPGVRGANSVRKQRADPALRMLHGGGLGRQVAPARCVHLAPPLPRPGHRARLPWWDGPPVPGKRGESARVRPPFTPQTRPCSVRPRRLPPRWRPLPLSEALLWPPQRKSSRFLRTPVMRVTAQKTSWFLNASQIILF